MPWADGLSDVLSLPLGLVLLGLGVVVMLLWRWRSGVWPGGAGLALGALILFPVHTALMPLAVAALPQLAPETTAKIVLNHSLERVIAERPMLAHLQRIGSASLRDLQSECRAMVVLSQDPRPPDQQTADETHIRMQRAAAMTRFLAEADRLEAEALTALLATAAPAGLERYARGYETLLGLLLRQGPGICAQWMANGQWPNAHPRYPRLDRRMQGSLIAFSDQEQPPVTPSESREAQALIMAAIPNLIGSVRSRYGPQDQDCALQHALIGWAIDHPTQSTALTAVLLQ